MVRLSRKRYYFAQKGYSIVYQCSYDVEFAADGEYENEVCKNVKEVEEELDHHANAKELLVHHANCEPKAHGALGFGNEAICAGEVWFAIWQASRAPSVLQDTSSCLLLPTMPMLIREIVLS